MEASRKAAIRTVRAVLSASFGCGENDFDAEGPTFHVAVRREGGLRFPLRERSLGVVTMGKGVVVSCNEDRIDWVKRLLEPLTRGQLFSARTIANLQRRLELDGQYLAGPDQKYVCTAEDAREFDLPPGVAVTTLYGEDIHALYEYKAFGHALAFRKDTDRPDRIAVVAECGGNVVGVAGASADCDALWQIGVDVLPEHRGGGIGKALVGTLTGAVLREGVLPYYSAEVSNLQSRQLAVTLGYWPVWTELYAREETVNN